MESLRRLRQKAGISMAKVGAPLVYGATICRYENGERNMDQLIYLVLLKRNGKLTWDEIGNAIEEELVSLLSLKD